LRLEAFNGGSEDFVCEFCGHMIQFSALTYNSYTNRFPTSRKPERDQATPRRITEGTRLPPSLALGSFLIRAEHLSNSPILQNDRMEFVGNAPYGFRLAAGKRHIETDRAEQSVLKCIRQLRENGMSLRANAAELNRRRRTTRQGSRWRME
jgi:hypothetical protein